MELALVIPIGDFDPMFDPVWNWVVVGYDGCHELLKGRFVLFWFRGGSHGIVGFLWVASGRGCGRILCCSKWGGGKVW